VVAVEVMLTVFVDDFGDVSTLADDNVCLIGDGDGDVIRRDDDDTGDRLVCDTLLLLLRGDGRVAAGKREVDALLPNRRDVPFGVPIDDVDVVAADDAAIVVDVTPVLRLISDAELDDVIDDADAIDDIRAIHG
jgi:hypothetical protein